MLLLRFFLVASSYKIIIIGGGTGGCSLSHRFHKLVPKGQIAVIEPSQEHHYQPGYTLVGGNLYTLPQCIKPMKAVLHRDNVWINQSVAKINANDNFITLNDGTKISYELLLVAAGIELRFDMIGNLAQAMFDPNICSIYRADLAQKTQKVLQLFDRGEAIFTLPNTPVKCTGAAQKICYLADEIFRQRGVRDQIHLTFNTPLSDIFDVPKYARVLNEIVKNKSIELKLFRNLKSVDITKREATFEVIGTDAKPTGQIEVQKFDLLHVTPPCLPPQVLRNSPDITNAANFLDVNPKSLQHVKYANIFGIGDCIGSPNKKTAAALFTQMRTLSKNIPRFLEKKPILETYDCYSSCPIIVSFRHVVLAEFTPKGPLETLPINQAKPRFISFLMKRYLLPWIYWTLGIKGHWLGPTVIRKIIHLGASK
ncbi:unnamed protein product [Thelazia callipaeda]|uniref:Sulfide:quinone oxidoreductase, mitochondrial n=1 Tax=Thelazia callipaeda TaxID=103827 RepID=A0A0N5D370_THECL|nr:unnamed protein product [Thelazia callipaeda]